MAHLGARAMEVSVLRDQKQELTDGQSKSAAVAWCQKNPDAVQKVID